MVSGEYRVDSWWLPVDMGWMGVANCKEGVASSECRVNSWWLTVGG